MKNNNLHNNPLFTQYMREYQRLTQVFRRMEKKGYIIPEEIKPEKPSKLKTVTQSDVNWLIHLTPKEIRERSYYVDPSTGKRTLGLDVVKSTHVAKPSVQKVRTPKSREADNRDYIKHSNDSEIPRQNSNPNKKSVEGEIPPKESNLNLQIIERITNMLEEWEPRPYWSVDFTRYKAQLRFGIMDKWNAALMAEGEYQLAYRLENKAEYYHRIVDRVIHFSDSPWDDQINLNEIVNFLTGSTLSAEEYEMYYSQADGYIRDIIVGDSFG